MWLTILATFTLAMQLPQPPPRDAPKPGAAMASVSGRVTDKETGQPLRGFRVMVERRTAGQSRAFEAETDDEGRFTIAGLAPGEYYAMASAGEFRAGHIGRMFSAGDAPRLPFSAPPTFELKPAESKADLDFALDRTFAVEGRVVNEYGEGLADIEVSGERADGQVGGTMSVSTDDRGQFRVYNVVGGSWRICARPGNVFPGSTPTGGDALEVRFVRTCFPAATGSAAVEITSSDVGGVLITMQRDRAYSISGQVLDASGTPVPGASIHIERLDPATAYGSMPSVQPEVSGNAFVARGLTSGEYLVRATVQEPYDQYAPTRGFPGYREMGLAKVRVEAGDVAGVTVTTSRGVDAAGRIRFDGTPGSPPSPARFQINGQRARDDQRTYQNTMIPTAIINADWTFEVRRLYGPIFITAYDTSGEWILQSVRYRGTDITDVPTEFKPGPDSQTLEITLTNRHVRVTVRAVDDDGKPAKDVVVLMLPANPARWRTGFNFPQRPEKDGRFLMPPRPTGEYLMLAVPAQQVAGLMRTPDDLAAALAAIAPHGQRVSLEPGEHALDVKVVKLPERQ